MSSYCLLVTGVVAVKKSTIILVLWHVKKGGTPRVRTPPWQISNDKRFPTVLHESLHLLHLVLGVEPPEGNRDGLALNLAPTGMITLLELCSIDGGVVVGSAGMR